MFTSMKQFASSVATAVPGKSQKRFIDKIVEKW